MRLVARHGQNDEGRVLCGRLQDPGRDQVQRHNTLGQDTQSQQERSISAGLPVQNHFSNA